MNLKKFSSNKWVRFSAILVVVAGLVVWATNVMLHSKDEEFVQYRDNGAGINKFFGSFAKKLERAVVTKELDEIMACYADDYASTKRGNWVFADPISQNGVTHTWLIANREGPGKDFTRKELEQEWTQYVNGIQKIDGPVVNGKKPASDAEDRGLGVVCKINILEELEVGESAQVTVKFLLHGRGAGGQIIHDRFFFRWWLRSTGEGVKDWVIIKDELLEDSQVTNLRVTSQESRFEKLDLVEVGIVETKNVNGSPVIEPFRHRRDPKLDPDRPDVDLKFGVIQHAGGGVTAHDYDQDGWVDIFFSDGVESRLYRNLGLIGGKLKFHDVTEVSGLEGIDRAHSAIFADFNNDGVKDLFVARYDAGSQMFLGEGKDLGVEEKSGGHFFRDSSKEMGLALSEPCVSACCLDYNRDGFIDIYIGVNGDAVNEVPRVPFFARNGRPNILLKNNNGASFTDVTTEAGVGDTGWTLAVCQGDLDGDGWTDIAVSNDFGRKNLYRNLGNGKFEECAQKAGTLDFSGGMGIAMGDLNGDLKMDLYTSNIYSNQRWLGEHQALLQYSRNLVRSKWFFKDFGEYWDLYHITEGDWESLGKMAGEGNSLFINECQNGEWKFREARESCTNRAGWGWGVALADIDNDSDLDIYAANGWITGELVDDL